MSSTLVAVRFPADEMEAAQALFDRVPGVSPAEVIRALLHDAKPIHVTNQLAKYAVFKSKKGGSR